MQAYTITDIAAVNQPKLYNDLIISKDVLPPQWMTDTTALENQTFRIRVTITGADANTTYTTGSSVTFVTDANGTATQVIELKDAQSLIVYGLPEGAAYSVAEVNIPAGYTANATESAPITGVISAHGTAVAGVTNTYAPQAAELTLTLTGTKTFLTSGNDTVPDEEWPGDGFTVELYRIDGGVVQLVKGDIKATADSKSWSAEVALTFDKTGIYQYKVVEKKGTANDITYDASEGLFQVVVSDDASGQLKISQIVAVQGTVEVNGYTVTKNFVNYKDAGSVRIPVQKYIQGTDAFSADTFFFGLYDSEGNLIDTIQGNGAFIIAGYGEDFVTAKHYTIREIIPEEENRIVGMTYDDTVYDVYVQWANDALVAAVAGTADNVAVFTNVYQEISYPSINLGGTKVLEGREMVDGEFTFELYENGERIRTATNVDGKFTFEAIEYTQVGVYTYTVVEHNPDQSHNVYDGVVYDTTEYVVTVTVVGNNGALEATVSHSREELVFVNKVYEEPPAIPQTGDSFAPGLFITLMVVSSLGLAAVVIAKKREETNG